MVVAGWQPPPTSGDRLMWGLRDRLLRQRMNDDPGYKERLRRGISSLKSSAENLADMGKQFQRELKEYFARDINAAIYKVTRPDDYRPDLRTVESIVSQTQQFVQNEDVTSNSNPFRLILTSIWERVMEEDWRTTIKGLALLHKLLRDVNPENALCFNKLFNKMSREECDHAGHMYFSLPPVVRLNAEGQAWSRFMRSYFRYVRKRAKTFTSQFAELELLGFEEMHPEEIIFAVLKARKNVEAILACAFPREEYAEVSMWCLELLAEDLHHLWHLFHDRLDWVFNQAKHGNPPLFRDYDQEEAESLILELKRFYTENCGHVQAFLTEADELLSYYGIPCSENLVDLPVPHHFDGTTGACSNTASTASSSSQSTGGASEGCVAPAGADLPAHTDARSQRASDEEITELQNPQSSEDLDISDHSVS